MIALACGLVLGLVPAAEPIEQYYPILVVNAIWYGDEPRLIQVGGLDFECFECGETRWQWWRTGIHERIGNVRSGDMVFHDNGTLRRIRYGSIQFRPTREIDPEIVDRERFPVEYRRGLEQPIRVVPKMESGKHSPRSEQSRRE